MSITDELTEVEQRAQDELAAVTDLNGLAGWKSAYLGKGGAITRLSRGMGALPAEERPLVGQQVNRLRATLEQAYSDAEARLKAAACEATLASDRVDVTLPGRRPELGRLHLTTQVFRQIIAIFAEMGFQVWESREVETDDYNFGLLNFLPDHPARDMQDTFYLPDGNLLRTHTSSVQIRYMENNEPPIRIIAPGRVYRRDTVDATHSAVFHQIEILAVDEDITFGDLKGTLKVFFQELFGEDVDVRLRASYFPFTEPSAEVDVKWRGKWLEMGGCGMVDPNVLKTVGYDPEIYTGFAAGFGAERFALVMHQIDDIRRLYTSDLRFLQQF